MEHNLQISYPKTIFLKLFSYKQGYILVERV